MKGYYAELGALLRAHGWAYLRSGKGSHEIWNKGGRHITVPRNCYSRHTANAVLKDAGISRKL